MIDKTLDIVIWLISPVIDRRRHRLYIFQERNKDLKPRLFLALDGLSSEDQFIQTLTQAGATPSPSMKGAITTKTWLYRIKSTGEVGNARVTVEAVIDFSSSAEGKLLYWRLE